MTMRACVVVLVFVACGSRKADTLQGSSPAGIQVIETDELTVPVPAGYRDATASYREHFPDMRVAFTGKDSRGEVVVIVLERAPIPRWGVEAKGCADRGANAVAGPGTSPMPPGITATLRGSTVVQWGGDPACEIDFTTSTGGPKLITERLDPTNPDGDGWMLLCQHNDDAAAIAECRATRGKVVLKRRP
jgi:hypothetical protein